MTTNVALDAALDAAFARLETLAANATSNDLAYLGHYLKNAGPGSLLAQLILAGDVQLEAIEAAKNAALVELQAVGGGIRPGSRPVLFGSGVRNSQLGDNTTTALGQMHINGQAAFNLIVGLHGNANEERWRLPPSLNFILGDSWHYSDIVTALDAKYSATYPDFAIAVIFLKNTTSADITRNIGHIYTSGWNTTAYGGSSLSIGVPNNTNANKSLISAVSWTTIHSKTAATNNEQRTDAVTIPAGKTVAVVKYASAVSVGAIYTDSTLHGIKCGFYGIGAALGGGIEFDTAVTERAQQISLSADFDAWKV